MTDGETAQRCAEVMIANDKASRNLGIEVTVDRAGAATARFEVTEAMLNGHSVCHGGFIFALADTAFAYACNGYNQLTLAAAASIDFLRPARKGDILTAVAKERHRGGRSGVYDVVVSNQEDEKIGLFRGRSHATRHTVLD